MKRKMPFLSEGENSSNILSTKEWLRIKYSSISNEDRHVILKQNYITPSTCYFDHDSSPN